MRKSQLIEALRAVRKEQRVKEHYDLRDYQFSIRINEVLTALIVELEVLEDD